MKKTLLAAVAMLAAVGSASAQTWPSQPVKIVVPFSGGSATDIFARIIGDELSKTMGQPFVVENKPGLPGTVSVAQAPADGYTLMLTSNGHTVAKVINKDAPFDPVKDFAGITQVASVPLVLIVNPSSPYKTVKDLVTDAKAKPGTINFASPGLGSSTFLAAALFKESQGINITHIPYKGAPEANMSVVRGDAQMYFMPVVTGAQLISENKVRALAVVSPTRLDMVKDVPTMKEAGYGNYTYDSWFGLMTRAGTPKPIIDRLNKEVVAILAKPDVKEKMMKQGAIPVTQSPAQFDALIKSDTERLAKVFPAKN